MGATDTGGGQWVKAAGGLGWRWVSAAGFGRMEDDNTAGVTGSGSSTNNQEIENTHVIGIDMTCVLFAVHNQQGKQSAYDNLPPLLTTSLSSLVMDVLVLDLRPVCYLCC